VVTAALALAAAQYDEYVQPCTGEGNECHQEGAYCCPCTKSDGTVYTPACIAGHNLSVRQCARALPAAAAVTHHLRSACAVCTCDSGRGCGFLRCWRCCCTARHLVHCQVMLHFRPSSAALILLRPMHPLTATAVAAATPPPLMCICFPSPASAIPHHPGREEHLQPLLVRRDAPVWRHTRLPR
jgi:hypothetical protein